MPFPKHIKSHKTGLHFLKHTQKSHKDDEILHFLKITLKNLVPNTYMRSLPRTKAAAYKHSLKFTLTESWHKSNIEFPQYNIMTAIAMKECVKKGLYCMKSQKLTKSLLGDLLFLIGNNKISYWNSTLILHNHHPQPPDHHPAANFTPPHLHVYCLQHLPKIWIAHL